MAKPNQASIDRLINVLNSLLPPDDRICNEECAHGGGCSLSHGHIGDHAALGTNGETLCTWPQ